MGAFGSFVRDIRMKNSITLREFCRNASIDPSNWSKIERGVLQPPKTELLLKNIAKSLNIKDGSDEYKTLLELAAIEYIPTELLSNQSIVDRLPVFFRTARGDKPNRKELEELIKLLSNSEKTE